MLQITIPAVEMWDEGNERFISTKEQKLTLEHSLVSLSKWESKWHKPYLSKQIKTFEETVDYVRCMTITQNVDPDVYKFLTNENIEEVNKYIEEPMTATWFSKDRRGARGPSNSPEQTTSEIIYHQMISLGIPFECQKWHLNRLLTLIQVCSIKSQKPNSMSRNSVLRQNAALNAARRKRYNTKG